MSIDAKIVGGAPTRDPTARVGTPAVPAPLAMRRRARAIACAGGIDAAVAAGELPARVDVTLSEGVVLGLLKQGVRKYLAIFGHGSTDLAEVLRVYQEEGATFTYNFRNEVEMAHVASVLRWQFGELCAVVTSIGPGAMQAMAGSLAAASNGVGVYHIYGDETTHGEGYNMQQVPKPEQELFGRITALMGESYVLHTPDALRDALRRGALRVGHPYRPGPFYLLLPINMQPAPIAGLNLAALPSCRSLPRMGVVDEAVFDAAADRIRRHRRVVIKVGGGSRDFGPAIRQLAERVGGAVVLSPGALGVLPDAHPHNMHVGGSKGSISGNYAMANGDLAIIIGSRGVCQADCSGIGYEKAEAVINLNGDLADVDHYNKTLALPGDIGANLARLLAALERNGGVKLDTQRGWLDACRIKKAEWRLFKEQRYATPPLADAAWGRPVLTQPVAIKTVADFAKSIDAVKYFDAGDVQANGFQIIEDDRPRRTFTETGASYMGFAPSAIAAAGLADAPEYGIAFCGDGSFMMNPQILIDAVEFGARGMVVIFDNRRMAAITGLQEAQYGHDFRTNDSVAVDYVRLASAVNGVQAIFGGTTVGELQAALRAAHQHAGLSVVHVPVYAGPDPRGGMGAYGAWNVGNWCTEVQDRYHGQDI
ncbi:MAG TPA: thiamine pyrophosphate-dependent enzyme [Stellaceae bacterium]|nr:thiamine pyrophosphate-dependent enzyme [Stellaceae bacterium]